MKQAVIFDLDGTLADTVASMAYCANRALEDMGYPAHPAEAYKGFAGDGADELVRRCLRSAGDLECAGFEEMKAKYREYFAKDCMYQVKPYQGIPELLAALKERGIRTAVLSNKPHKQAVDVVESLFGKDCFDEIQGQTDKIARKPSPDGVYVLLDRMGLQKEQCLYAGDTNTDMQTGKAAGLYTAGVLWGFRDQKELEESGADIVVSAPKQLLWIVCGQERRA